MLDDEADSLLNIVIKYGTKDLIELVLNMAKSYHTNNNSPTLLIKHGLIDLLPKFFEINPNLKSSKLEINTLEEAEKAIESNLLTFNHLKFIKNENIFKYVLNNINLNDYADLDKQVFLYQLSYGNTSAIESLINKNPNFLDNIHDLNIYQIINILLKGDYRFDFKTTDDNVLTAKTFKKIYPFLLNIDINKDFSVYKIDNLFKDDEFAILKVIIDSNYLSENELIQMAMKVISSDGCESKKSVKYANILLDNISSITTKHIFEMISSHDIQSDEILKKLISKLDLSTLNDVLFKESPIYSTNLLFLTLRTYRPNLFNGLLDLPGNNLNECFMYNGQSFTPLELYIKNRNNILDSDKNLNFLFDNTEGSKDNKKLFEICLQELYSYEFNPAIGKFLLDKGVPISTQQDSEGNNLAHLVAMALFGGRYTNKQFIEDFVIKFINLAPIELFTQVNNNGKTPLDLISINMSSSSLRERANQLITERILNQSVKYKNNSKSLKI